MKMELQSRKLPRLTEYDYATPGAYFVTICSHDKQCIFGKVIMSTMPGEAYVQYSDIGRVAAKCLLEMENHYSNVKIDNWVIMPNHIHILIRIAEPEVDLQKEYDIPNVVGKYKAAVTRAVRHGATQPRKIWQSSYHDHIVRDEKDYKKIWEYISGNPSKWLDDCFYPKLPM
jgi:REP element-mobilizing transposase RayT